MKIMQQELVEKLAAVKSAVPARPSIPALNGVLVKDNTLTAYNLDYGITTTMSCNAEESFILPMAGIQMIESLPPGEMELKLDPGSKILEIKSGKIVHQVCCQPPDDFPELPEVTSNKKYKIDADTLIGALDMVIYAVSTNISHPIQNGILFDASGDGDLNFVACDGCKLAWYHIPFQGKFSFVVPSYSLKKLMKLKTKDTVEFIPGKHHAIFMTNGTRFVIRLLEGKFMDYRSAVRGHSSHITVERKQALESLHRASLCIEDIQISTSGKPTDRRAPLKLTVEKGDEEIGLAIQNNISKYTEQLSIAQKAGFDLCIGFNARYLSETIQRCESDSIDIELGKELEPAVIRDGAFTALALPVRLRKEGGINHG